MVPELRYQEENQGVSQLDLLLLARI